MAGFFGLARCRVFINYTHGHSTLIEIKRPRDKKCEWGCVWGWLVFVLVLMMVMAGIGLWRLQARANTTEAMVKSPIAISDCDRNLHAGVRRNVVIAKSFAPSLGPVFAADAVASIKALGEMRRQIKAIMDRENDDNARGIQSTFNDIRNMLVGLGLWVLALGIAFASWLVISITSLWAMRFSLRAKSRQLI